MNSTNINDPAGVKALLDQLRVSQAWQEAVSVAIEPQTSPVALDQQLVPASGSRVASVTETPSASVAALLSQLQSSPSWRPLDSTTHEHENEQVIGHSMSPVPIELASAQPVVPSPPRPIQDPKTFTFQQALPYLARLADDPTFVVAITRLKGEQDDLERQLWEERRDIQRRYEEKVKVAKTKASMLGDPGLSKHEADMLQTGLKKELEKFDRDRVLVAWDGLISRQQTVLAQHSVPTMFPTIETVDRERQQRVMQVLDGILRT